MILAKGRTYIIYKLHYSVVRVYEINIPLCLTFPLHQKYNIYIEYDYNKLSIYILYYYEKVANFPIILPFF